MEAAPEHFQLWSPGVFQLERELLGQVQEQKQQAQKQAPLLLFVQKQVQLKVEHPELVQKSVQQQYELVQLVEVLVQLGLRVVLVAGKLQQMVEQVQQTAGTDR